MIKFTRLLYATLISCFYIHRPRALRKIKILFLLTTIFIAAFQPAKTQSININGPAGSGQFGYSVTALTNGNYVVTDPYYDDGALTDVGAVYLYNGSTHALISTLKGSTANDRVGIEMNITRLPNGNFIVRSPNWNGDRGAVTWGNGVTGVSGVVSSSNSLLGGTAGDNIGNHGIDYYLNSNYIVSSANWDNGTATDAGAITWGNGSTGVSGVVSSSNSFVGSRANDNVGYYGSITYLSNGNFLLRSKDWDNGTAVDAGAITWFNGSVGIAGFVSSGNSLVGSSSGDNVGINVINLTNGNYLVLSASWDNGAATNAGAVTWGNGTSGISGVISSANSLVGSAANDEVGYSGITSLSNGNYVVRSANWDNGAAINAGAVTFGNGTTGVSGVLSSSNSLVGGTSNNSVGNYGIIVLTNGNYVVSSPNWDNGAASDAGAITWCSNTIAKTGVVSSSNSLVGGAANNQLGFNGVGYPTIIPLSNGHYVVSSPMWDNGAVLNVGAVTWCNGTTGRTGVVSSSNSLVGGSTDDQVGNYGITALNNGNYVVRSLYWSNGAAFSAGAVTWGNGTSGISGLVGSSNSLVGTKASDEVGSYVKALNNGNYVVSSGNWDNGAIQNAGAVTWCNGTTGRLGVLSSINSLVGNKTNDGVGNNETIAFNNGNYVVVSPNWGNGAATNAGAVTWGNGTTGIFGVVSSSNSLVGSTVGAYVGVGITDLNNGNYLVRSPYWNNGALLNLGAVTWVNGSTGKTGVVSSSNSLVGSTTNDYSDQGVSVLSNGNYVLRSPYWDNGPVLDAGAITWGNGNTGVSGILSSSNSLVGTNASDNIGFYDGNFTVQNNGNYILRSPLWDNGSAQNAGAITFGNGSAGIFGEVSSNNSLVGTTTNDNVGNYGITVYNNVNYLTTCFNWDNGATTDVGAVTLSNATSGFSGTITSCNSVLGSTTGGGNLLAFVFNSVYENLIVGRRTNNIVTIFNPGSISLANSLDTISVNINSSAAVPLIASTGCRIIATLTPNGASAVNGLVNAKAWIEASVPTHYGQPFVARHFEITPATNTSTATGKVTLYFTQQEFTDFNNHANSTLDLPTDASDATGIANLRVGKYSGTTNNGTGLPGSYIFGVAVIDPVDSDIVWNSILNRWEVSFNVTGFSGFIIQTIATALPLSLLEFSGRLQNTEALLTWKTENEINTHSFNLERSTDGRNYTSIFTVAAFNTAGVHQYNFIDPNITSLAVPVVYYRLKQKDIDGRFTYSQIVALSPGNKNIVLFYPNPVQDKASLMITSNKPEQVQYRIIDNAGRIITEQKRNVVTGSNSLSVDVSRLANGMYWLEITSETINERRSFIKQ